MTEPVKHPAADQPQPVIDPAAGQIQPVLDPAVGLRQPVAGIYPVAMPGYAMPEYVVEVSRDDALSLGIAAEAIRKLGNVPPVWMTEGAALVDPVAAPVGDESVLKVWTQRLFGTSSQQQHRL